MTNLTRTEIAALAKGAGFSGNDINIAVAVALAESGGNPRAHNSKPPDNSYGLWQINMLGDMGPDRRKRFGLTSNEDLFNPAINAKVARGIWEGSGWSAWTTYTRGTYKKHLEGDLSGVEGVSTTEEQSASGEPILGITAAINAFGETILKAFASTGAVIVAVVLLVLGFVLLARNPIAKLSPAGTAGKVAKTIKKVGG